MSRSIKGPWFRSAKNTWYATLEGKSVSLKVQGEKNEAEAVRAWHRLMGGMPLDAPSMPLEPPPKPKAEPQAEVKPVSVQEVIDGFLADAEGRISPDCLINYRARLLPFAERHGKRSAEALTSSQAEACARKPEWSSSYRHVLLGTLITAFRWAERSRLIAHNPLNSIRKPPKASRGAKALISAEDHERLCKHADGLMRAFLQLLWLTGARPGEIASLTAQEVDTTNRLLILTEHKCAHIGKSRTLFLTDEAITILQDRITLHPDGLLFPGKNGQHISSTAMSQRMIRLCDRAGVKAIAYGYRHTFATDALAYGVPDAQVAALLGHSGTAMLHKHYSHLGARANALREALGKVRG